MKVLCINTSPMFGVGKCTLLQEGNKYNVVCESPCFGGRDGYILQEVKSLSETGAWFKERFIPISTIDETELIKERLVEQD